MNSPAFLFPDRKSLMLSTLSETVVAFVGDRNVSLLHLLRELNLRGQLRPLLSELLIDESIRQYAESHSLCVSDEELQQAADQFRRGNSLHSADETHSWLRERGMAPLDLEQFLELSILRERVFQHLTGGARQIFQEQKSEWDRITLQVIRVEQENLAEELMSQLLEGSGTFEDLAKQHSSHPSASLGGRLDPSFRRNLPEDLGNRLRNAVVGQILSPLATADGWSIFRVENLHEAILDRETEKAVRSQIYTDWILGSCSTQQTAFPLLDAICQ